MLSTWIGPEVLLSLALCQYAIADQVTSSPVTTSHPATAGALPALAVLADPVAGETLAPLAALLEVKLSADARLRLVEREAIQKVLGEQELQTLFGATDAAKRISVGELIKADLLVLLRTARPEPGAKAVDVVVCETRAGLRLRVETLSGLEKPEAVVAGLQAIVDEALAKYVSAVRLVIAVPPFVSKDFLHTHDDLKRRCSRYAQQSLETWPELVLVELEEAEAIAEELAVAGKERSVDRQLPLYLLGEYGTTEKDGQLRVSMQLMIRQGGRTLVQRVSDAVGEDGVQSFIVDAAQKMVTEVAGGSSNQHDPVTEAAQLVKRARVFMETAHWEEAMDLVEAAVLLQPDDLKLRETAIEVAAQCIGTLARSPKRDQPSRDLEPGQPTDAYLARASQALAYARRGLVHTERWIRLKDMRAPQSSLSAGFFTRVDGSLAAWRRNEVKVQVEKDAQRQFDDFHASYREMLFRALEEKIAARVIVDSALGGFETGLHLHFDEALKMRFVRVIQDVPDAQDRIISLIAFGFSHSKGVDASYRVDGEGTARELLKPEVRERVEVLAQLPGRSAQRAVKILRRLMAEVPAFWSKHEQEMLDAEMYSMEVTKRMAWAFHRGDDGRVGLLQLLKEPVPWLEAASDPPKVVSSRPEPASPDVTLERLELVLAGRLGDRAVPVEDQILGWKPCGRECDFAWTDRTILLMRHPGRLETVFSHAESVLHTQDAYPKPMVFEPFYDGKYIWAAVRDASGLSIIAIDPRSSSVFSLTEKTGMPPAAQGLQLESIEPGTVCVAAAFGRAEGDPSRFDRTWCALVSLGTGGNAVVDMLVEASKQRNEAAATNDLGRIGEVFVPTGLLALPDAEGGKAKRVLILRSGGRFRTNGLVADLATRQVVPAAGAPGWGFQEQRLYFDNRLYVAGRGLGAPGRDPIWEFSLPDPQPEEVGSTYRAMINGPDGAPVLLQLFGTCPMAVQGEYVHMIRCDGAWSWWVGRCPSTRMYSLHIEWPKAALAYRSECWIRPSSHYGIVVFAAGKFYRARVRPESLASVEPLLAADASSCRREHAEADHAREALRQRAGEARKAPLSAVSDEPLLEAEAWFKVAGIVLGGSAVIALIRRRRSRCPHARRNEHGGRTETRET